MKMTFRRNDWIDVFRELLPRDDWQDLVRLITTAFKIKLMMN